MQIVGRITHLIDARYNTPSERPNRTAPAARGAVFPAAVMFLCMAMADAVPAREAAAPLKTLLRPDISSEDIRRVMRAGTDGGGRLERLQIEPNNALQQGSASQTIIVASESRAWNMFLDRARRIDRLPRSIARSLHDLGQSRADRSRGSPAKSRIDSDSATVAWQLRQIPLDRIAIPQPRPLKKALDGETRPHPILAMSGLSNDFFSDGRTRYSIATLLVALTIVGLAYRHRKKTRRSRERAFMEKAVYDAIAELPLENGQDFRAGVSGVLTQVEMAYNLAAASVVLVHPDTFEVQNVYSREATMASSTGIIEDAVAEIRKRGDYVTDVTLWRYSDATGLSEDNRLEPNAITSVVWRGDRAGTILIAKCRSGAGARTADAKAIQIVTQLLAVVIEEHERPTAISSDRDELAGNLAHEFNNLLMPIMGYAEMAADALNPGSSPRAYIERIQSAGERAKHVIDQMLNFSGRSESALGSFDVTAATSEILSDLKMCIPASTTLRTNLPAGPTYINGSAATLQQAMINLCKNASEAMVDGGTITVGVAVIEQSIPRSLTHGRLSAGRYVRVSIADTGPGIPPDNLRMIFEPFFTTRRGEGGTGLGLAMVLRTVKLLNGGLNVRSSSGWGTRFDLFFPCRSEMGTVVPMWATAQAG